MRFLPLLLLGAALPVAAELRVENLEAQRSEWETYRFPLFNGDSPAIGRINTYLHAVVLNGLPGRFERSPFERIWPKEGEIWGTNNIDYMIDGQGPGYLSLSVTGEYTGAYTSMGTFTYPFDLTSGRPIGLEQLFTPAGLQRLGERVGHERGQRIEAFLAELPPPADATAELDEDDERLETQRSMYQECLPRRSNSDLTYNRVELGRDSLKLIAEGCAPHVVLALDDLGEYSNSIPYAQLADDFSPYGRCLLLEQRSDCQRPADLRAGGAYRGKIDGRYAISLVLEGNVYASSSYFYERYARQIELSQRTISADQVRLYEGGDNPAIFDLHLQPDGSLTGTWQQQGGKALPVELR
ncbi:hypothetical protein ACF8C1_24415 [Pseudomonas sp. zjy_9]